MQGALSQCAMTNIAARSAAQRLDFAGGERREIVMVHVALGIGRGQGVQLLGFARRAQGCQGEHLGFAAGEQAGAVGARADIDIAPDRADFGQAAPIRAHDLAPGCGCEPRLFEASSKALSLPLLCLHLRRPAR